jgi:hypothetical protein
MNAFCALQARTGQNLLDLMKDVDVFSPQALRSGYWGALQHYHSAEFPTEESAGDFIDGMGGVLVAFVKFRELLELNQPRSGNPQTPAATGEGSSLRAVG